MKKYLMQIFGFHFMSYVSIILARRTTFVRYMKIKNVGNDNVTD